MPARSPTEWIAGDSIQGRPLASVVEQPESEERATAPMTQCS